MGRPPVVPRHVRACGTCGKELILPAYRLRPMNFCSRSCHDTHQRNQPREILLDPTEVDRRCKACGVIKSITEFGEHARYRNGRLPRCKSCVAEADYQRKHAHDPEPPLDGIKRCRGCEVDKPLASFARHRTTRDGYSTRCADCRRAKREEQRQTDKAFDRYLKSTYNVDLTWYEATLAQQGGGCASCGRGQPAGAKSARLYVDHCHATGRVRGLLCGPCNSALGLLRESPARIVGLARYAKYHQLTECVVRSTRLERKMAEMVAAGYDVGAEHERTKELLDQFSSLIPATVSAMSLSDVVAAGELA